MDAFIITVSAELEKLNPKKHKRVGTELSTLMQINNLTKDDFESPKACAKWFDARQK